MYASTKQKWSYRPREIAPGGVAQLSWSGDMVGKLVHVEHVVAELDWSAVSASIDTDPYFSRDGHGSHPIVGRNAWHAVRIHNFCRPMGSAEACCERIGSNMHAMWDTRRPKGNVSAMMDETILEEAQVLCCHHMSPQLGHTLRLITRSSLNTRLPSRQVPWGR